jgi:DUF1680 family protein
VTALIALIVAGLVGIHPVLYKVLPAQADVIEPVAMQDVILHGYLGDRVDRNELLRLREVDLEPLLIGFHKQPGTHPWIGEHIGKWIHAATLAWANSNDDKLKIKLDKAVHDFISYQEPSGYLGTYLPSKRFGLYEGADWDVWTHKYDLIGLLTYYRYTGDKKVLSCCQRIGDLLANTFGPGKRSILSAGTHMGMAATSVLEPVVLLYRHTGDIRYLDFAKYLVQSWNDKGGPHILATLNDGKPIDEVGNGKAYEMLSNLVGVCELARVTGDKEYLDAAKHAWNEVVAHQLYITGSASYGEHFHAGSDLPNSTSWNIGETCVTVTWIQLSEQLLRLTGESKYGNEIERSFYNHLAAAQNPDGKSWCYYTSLEGEKPYTDETCCCLSSGPRGMAMAPEMTYFLSKVRNKTTIYVNLLETSRADFVIDGRPVTIVQDSGFPLEGKAQLSIRTDSSARFGIKVRVPSWSSPMRSSRPADVDGGWLTVAPRVWRNAETLYLRFHIGSSTVKGQGSNAGKVAMTWGPFVLAGLPAEGKKNVVGSLNDQSLKPIGTKLNFAAKLDGSLRTVPMVPFAEAGQSGGRYKVWMNGPEVVQDGNTGVFADGDEQYSAEGNVGGSINDGDPGTYVVTFNGKKQQQAWFSVSSTQAQTMSRVVFFHGQTFHDGGWFDASREKPKIQIRDRIGGDWITVGVLSNYPNTSMTNSGGLRKGESFTCEFDRPVLAYAVRVVGVPASGDNSAQAFASCGELQAFAK